eukprot:GHVU01171840.1.p2 GENE.GHVU01171840.1~~GHVU01171840.1.p2  ORF type:complete len:164 (+),score=25.62 GHVU01171840.1:2-493(+)
MLTEVKRGDTVVVHSLSRLARSTSDACEIAESIQAAGASLVVLDLNVDTSTPMGACFFQIAAAFAELERKQIAERTSKAMVQHQANGRSVSSQAPYGYMKVGKELEECPEEMVWLKRIRKWDADGHSIGWIVKRLTHLGAVPRGNAWYRQTVQRSLEREVSAR